MAKATFHLSAPYGTSKAVPFESSCQFRRCHAYPLLPDLKSGSHGTYMFRKLRII